MYERYDISTHSGEMKNLIQDAPQVQPSKKKKLEKYNRDLLGEPHHDARSGMMA